MRLKSVRIFTKTILPRGLMLVLAVVALAASASAVTPGTKLAPEYLAGFAFFKFAGATPDFEAWIKASTRYINATPRERVIMLRSDAPMMEGYFNAYIPKENPIDIKVRVKFTTPSDKRADKMLAEDGHVKIKMKIIGQKEEFFPVQVGDMWIAMIPGNMAEITTLTFDKDEFAMFKRQINGTSLIGSGNGILHLSLLPISADIKEPLQIEGFNLWMLGVRVVNAELWDEKDKHMGWYVAGAGNDARHNSDQIFNLYKD